MGRQKKDDIGRGTRRYPFIIKASDLRKLSVKEATLPGIPDPLPRPVPRPKPEAQVPVWAGFLADCNHPVKKGEWSYADPRPDHIGKDLCPHCATAICCRVCGSPLSDLTTYERRFCSNCRQGGVLHG